jgi:adenylate kinase
MIVVLLGPPGVGKGTQARALGGRYGLEQVSTGDMVRAEVAQGTALGGKAKKHMDEGGLVPDEVILGMVEERIRTSSSGGFLLDGFPRTIPQADGLERMLERMGRRIDAVICLDIEDEKVVARLSNRRTCPVDGRVYNLLTQPPRVAGRCDDHPNQELVLRSDDAPETIRKRLEVYHDQTSPLIDYYRRRGQLKTVDGDGTVEQVTARVAGVLE